MILKVAYMGTPQIACPSLQVLTEMDGCKVIGVFTQPDRACGRGGKVEFSAVKRLALSHGLDIFQPESLKGSTIQDTLGSLDLDLIIVMAYGQILPQNVLDLPKYGALNIHASILPRHRGAAPIQWAIIEGDNETGVSLMKMDAGLDTGGVLSIMTTQIEDADSAVDLTNRISHLGAEILTKHLSSYIEGKLKLHKQNESIATYAAKIDKSHGLIDWTINAQQILRRLRAFKPWPGIYTYLPTEKQRTLKIVSAEVVTCFGLPGRVLNADEQGITIACGHGGLLITCLQREGGKQLSASEFLNGFPLHVGDILG